jgi:hypothetical protein
MTDELSGSHLQNHDLLVCSLCYILVLLGAVPWAMALLCRHQETTDAGQAPGVRSLDPPDWEDLVWDHRLVLHDQYQMLRVLFRLVKISQGQRRWPSIAEIGKALTSPSRT